VETAARAAVLAFTVAAFFWIVARTLAGSPRERVLTVPDDGFYYLTLARNFATHGIWSFDSGVSRTNGFHLLHGYALATLFSAVHPSADRFVALGIGLSWLAAVPAWIAGAVFAWRRRSWVPLLTFGVIAASRNALLNSVSVMEWPYVVSLAACYCGALWASVDAPSRARVAAVAACAFAGSLARTDFGLLPGMLLVVAFGEWLLWRGADAQRRFLVALIGTVSAAAGVGVALIHGWVTSGIALQSSARMKLLWMAFETPSWSQTRFKAQALFGPPFSYPTTALIALLVLAVATAAIPWLRRLTRDRTEASARWLWVSSVLTLLGYATFYRWDAAVQDWYTGNLLVPIFLVLTLPFAYGRTAAWLSAAASAVLLAMAVRQIVELRALPNRPLWPWQVQMYDAGTYLAQDPPDGGVASWNAGIIGFYSGGHVVNLDGLVNGDIYEYAAHNRLPAYIDLRGKVER